MSGGAAGGVPVPNATQGEEGGTAGLAWRLSAVAVGFACLLTVALAITAIHAHSLSGDGAYHLLAGHQALRYGQNSINIEHPPLVKLLVSAPLLLESEVLAPPLRPEEGLSAAETIHLEPELLRRATIRGRYVRTWL